METRVNCFSGNDFKVDAPHTTPYIETVQEACPGGTGKGDGVRKTGYFASIRGIAAVLIALVASAPILAADLFPEQRPRSTPDASHFLAGSAALQRGCLTPELRLARELKGRVSATERRAASWLTRHDARTDGASVVSDYGIELRLTRAAALRLDAMGPEIRDERLRGVADGVAQARAQLTERLGFPAANVTVLVADLGIATDGYTLRTESGSTIVIDVSTPIEDVRRGAAHQFAHAVAQAISDQLPPEWGEALAVWTTSQVLGQGNETEFAAIDARLQTLHLGLTSDDPVHATGNAAWLNFLHSRWGAQAVRTTIEELARGGDVAAALERGVRRVSPQRLAQAFADFQLWSLFTGDRDDGRHLRGASSMDSPRFTSAASGLPSLSIRRDPAVAPWGGSRIRLFEGNGESGGLRVDFEADFSAQWEADLVLTSRAGAIHRIPLAVRDGRVETTVPLDGLAEAILLVRRVDGNDTTPRGYSYSAHREKGYPFELADLSVEPIAGGALLVEWETTHEHQVIGFNLLRERADGSARVQLNPVWIPAVGASDRGVGYRYLDRDAVPGVRYEYTIQAITELGLTSHSAPIQATRK